MDQTTTTDDRGMGATTQTPPGTAETAKQQAGQVASTATEEAGRIASTAKDEAVDLTTTVKEQVSTVTSDVAAQGKQLVAEAKGQAVTTADHQVSKVSGSITSLTDQVTALLEGRPEEAGQVKDIAERAVREVNSLAARIDQRGVEGILDDVRSFARRKPGTFLLLAGAAGVGVGLLARGAKSGSGGTQQPAGVITPPSLTELPPLPPIAPAPGATTPFTQPVATVPHAPVAPTIPQPWSDGGTR